MLAWCCGWCVGLGFDRMVLWVVGWEEHETLPHPYHAHTNPHLRQQFTALSAELDQPLEENHLWNEFLVLCGEKKRGGDDDELEVMATQQVGTVKSASAFQCSWFDRSIGGAAAGGVAWSAHNHHPHPTTSPTHPHNRTTASRSSAPSRSSCTRSP